MRGFPVDGINDEIYASTTWDDLSGFLRNEDLINPTIFSFGASFCGCSSFWVIARNCWEGPNSTIGFVVFIW